MVESDPTQRIQFGDDVLPVKSTGVTAYSTGKRDTSISEKAEYDVEDKAAQIATADLNMKVCFIMLLFFLSIADFEIPNRESRHVPLQPVAFESTAVAWALAQLSHLPCFCRNLSPNYLQTYKGWMLVWLAYQSTGAIYGDIGTSPLVCIKFFL